MTFGKGAETATVGRNHLVEARINGHVLILRESVSADPSNAEETVSFSMCLVSPRYLASVVLST